MAAKQEKKEADADVVEQVAAVEHTPANAGVVFVDAKKFEGRAEGAVEGGYLGGEIEPHVEQEAEEGAQHKGDNLIVGEGTAEKADSHKHGAYAKQAQVRAQGGSAVDVALGLANAIQCNVVHEGGQQGEQQQDEGGQIFAQDDLPGGDGPGAQPFPGAGAELLGEGAHGEGGHQEEVKPRGPEEEDVQFGEELVQHVAFQHPDEEAQAQQEHAHHQIGN